MVLVTIVAGANLNQLITGGPHIVSYGSFCASIDLRREYMRVPSGNPAWHWHFAQSQYHAFAVFDAASRSSVQSSKSCLQGHDHLHSLQFHVGFILLYDTTCEQMHWTQRSWCMSDFDGHRINVLRYYKII